MQREILFDALGLSTLVTNSIIEGHMGNIQVVVIRLIDKCTHGLSKNM